jgi:hypothetical protein
VQVVFAGLAHNGIDKSLTATDFFLAKVLSAKISINTAANQLNVNFPPKIGESPIQFLYSGTS